MAVTRHTTPRGKIKEARQLSRASFSSLDEKPARRGKCPGMAAVDGDQDSGASPSRGPDERQTAQRAGAPRRKSRGVTHRLDKAPETPAGAERGRESAASKRTASEIPGEVPPPPWARSGEKEKRKAPRLLAGRFLVRI